MLEMQLFNQAYGDATIGMFPHWLLSCFYAGSAASQRLASLPREVRVQGQWSVLANPSWTSSCDATGGGDRQANTHAGSQPMKPSAAGTPKLSWSARGPWGNIMAVSEVFWFKKEKKNSSRQFLGRMPRLAVPIGWDPWRTCSRVLGLFKPHLGVAWLSLAS